MRVSQRSLPRCIYRVIATTATAAQLITHLRLKREGLTSAAGPAFSIDEPPSGCHITTVNWNLRDTSLSVVWLDPFADLPSARSRDVLSWVAKLLWSEALEPSDVRYLLLAAVR